MIKFKFIKNEALISYLEDLLDVGHRQLLEEGVKGGGAGTPVLCFTIGGVVFLNSVLFFVNSLFDGCSPFIL